MKIIKPSYEILDQIDGQAILKKIELCARVSHKSEGNITPTSAARLVKRLIDLGDESVLEHVSITVRFICDRGVSHELVRHRIAAFTQESTRYCNYSQGKFCHEITVVQPCFFVPDDFYKSKYASWIRACRKAEKSYFELLKNGATPEEARSVLPNSLKTEVICTANLRELRHILLLRADKRAHPQMRELMVPLLYELQKKIPVVFDDIAERIRKQNERVGSKKRAIYANAD
jgi:thymidylate synthase (FAD)